jgi:hypothetical protein
MKHTIFLLTSMLIFAMSFVACAPQAQATDVPVAGPTTSHGGPVENYVSLVDTLRAAGAEVEPGDTVEQAFFSVTGQIIKVNSMDVQVFEYESAEAMEADAAQVAPDGGSIGTSMVMWVEAPHFFKSGRVLVLYVGDDAAVLDLLESVLGEQFAGR